MPRTRAGTALALSAAAMLAPGGPGAHAAASPAVVTASGQVLRLGTVVARGRLDAGRCAFDGPAGVTLRSRAAASLSVTLRTDGACRVVVTALGRTSVDVATYGASPKVDRTATDGASATAVGISLRSIGPDLLAAATASEVMQVGLDQTVYDESGLAQYTDSVDAQYLRNRKTGDVSAMDVADGYCKGSTEDDVLSGFVNATTTEIHDCYYKTTYNGPTRVGFVTGGFYRERYLLVERDARALSESFDAWRDGYLTYRCDAGTLPRFWSHHCDFTLV